MSEKIETPWMTPEELRVYLGGISETTLYRYRDAGMPVHYIAGRTPRYHRDEVDQWIRGRKDES